MKRILIVSMVALVVALVGGTLDTYAACGVAKAFVTRSQQFGTTTLDLGADADLTVSGAVIGRWWQTTDRASVNEGGATQCPDDIWLIPDAGSTFTVYGYVSGSVGYGTCDPAGGCPVGDFSLVVQTTTLDGKGAKFILYRTLENTPTHAFDFSKGLDNTTALEIPRPRVTLSNRVTPNVHLNLDLDAVNGAYENDDSQPVNTSIVQYRLMQAASVGDPGRNPAAWVPLSTHTYTGSTISLTSVPVDCSNTAVDRWLALQPVFEAGSTDLLGDYVGRAVQIECDPTLADPDRFKFIKKTKEIGGAKRSR